MGVNLVEALELINDFHITSYLNTSGVATLLTLHDIGVKNLLNEISIIIFGREKWSKAIDFQLLADSGTFADDHLNLFQYADTELEAWEIISQDAPIEIDNGLIFFWVIDIH